MLYHEELEILFSATARRDIKPMDTLYLMAVISRLNWRSGKAEVTSEEIGELLGTDARVVRSSFSRLRKHNLLAYMKEGTSYFYSVHPSLMRAGRSDCRDLTIARWKREGLL
jgi:hypothetical protein